MWRCTLCRKTPLKEIKLRDKPCDGTAAARWNTRAVAAAAAGAKLATLTRAGIRRVEKLVIFIVSTSSVVSQRLHNLLYAQDFPPTIKFTVLSQIIHIPVLAIKVCRQMR